MLKVQVLNSTIYEMGCTLNELNDPHIDLVDGVLKIVHTNVMVSTRVVSIVICWLLVSAVVCLYEIKRTRKVDS